MKQDDHEHQEHGATDAEPATTFSPGLEPGPLRFKMTYAALFQMAHGEIKRLILDKVHSFYCLASPHEPPKCDDAMYRRAVLREGQSGPNLNPFKGSVRWLINAEAMTEQDGRVLDAIYRHRHLLAHELQSFLITPEKYLSFELFLDALRILSGLHEFWINVELQTGGFYDPSTGETITEVDRSDVMPASLVFLHLCVNAVGGDAQAPPDTHNSSRF